MSDDEDEPFTVDARTYLFMSAAAREKKAFNYFNRFLEGYCIQIGIDVVEDGTTIPYHGIPRKASEKDVFAFWDEMFGNFIYYMGNKTTLAESSAEQYCSGVKTHFTTKFRTEPKIPIFQPCPWRQLTDKLRGFFRQSNLLKGSPEDKIGQVRQ
jgi:hypothetical protein